MKMAGIFTLCGTTSPSFFRTKLFPAQIFEITTMAEFQKIGLLLSSDTSSSAENFVRAAHQLLDNNHNLYAYLLHTGVKQFSNPAISDLVLRGLHLHICSLAAEKQGIPFSEKAVFCGLGTLASIIRNTGSFIFFPSVSDKIEFPGPHALVTLAAQDTSGHPAGNTLETLRVAAGLAQLSDLTINLQLHDKALSLFELNTSHPELVQESTQYLHLLQEAGGTLFLTRETDACPIPYDLLSTAQKPGLYLEIA